MFRRSGRLTAQAAMIALSMLALGSCDAADDPALPGPPWQTPAENPLGDVSNAGIERLAGRLQHAIDAGKPTSEILYVVPGVSNVAALQDWYAPRAAAAGHVRVPGLDGALSPGEAAFGYRKGDQVLVVGWIRPKAAGPVPVVVMRFGRSGS